MVVIKGGIEFVDIAKAVKLKTIANTDSEFLLSVFISIIIVQRKRPDAFGIRPSKNLAMTYFRLTTIIGQKGLATEFGMGSGVSLSVLSPGNSLIAARCVLSKI